MVNHGAAAAGKGNRGRTKTEGSSDATTNTNASTNSLRFLERSERPAQSSAVFPDTVVAKPWPVEPVSSQPAARPRAWTVQSTQAARLPRNSPLAFLERDASNLSVSSLVTGSGSDAGLASLRTSSRGGRVASGGGSRDDLLTRPCGGLDGRRCELEESGEEEEEDDNVCPSMLFSCLPCLSCLRPDRRRRRFEGDPLDANNVRKDSIRSQGSLSTPLLSEQPLSPRDFPKDVKLIEVEVESARNLPLGAKESIAESAGTYVSLRMTPVQEGVGEQTEHTSIATRIVNPRWGGRETFTFFVTDTQHSKAMLALTLLYRPLQSPPAPPPHRANASIEASGAPVPSGSRPGDVVIGEGFVDLLGMFPVHNGTYTPGGQKGNSRRVAVPIREPVGKRRTKCSVMLGLRCRRVNETIDTHEDRLYEYQRWTQLAGWSTAGKQRVGKWSTVDGTVFSDNFAEVAPPAREDSEVVLPWCPFGGWEYSREDETTPPAIGRNTLNRDEVTPGKDPEDWENFTVGQKGAVWMEGHVSGYDSVRRRLWRRVYLDRGSSSIGLPAMTT